MLFHAASGVFRRQTAPSGPATAQNGTHQIRSEKTPLVRLHELGMRQHRTVHQHQQIYYLPCGPCGCTVCLHCGEGHCSRFTV